MKDKECPICKSKLIKFGSNVSCTNKDCPEYINEDADYTYVNVFYHDHIFNLVNHRNDYDENDYIEDYDDFLFFAQNPSYISRFEYREMNDFIEEKIFKGFKIAKFEKFLKEEEYDSNKVKEKYDLLKKGRDLEDKDPKAALDFYESQLGNKLFKNDYYLYRKIVKLENDPEKIFLWIDEFFRSGIYCNRYNYLWFLKKLRQISKKIVISDYDIDVLLKLFKKYGFTNKNSQDLLCPIAEKITMNNYHLKVRTEEEYTLKQFKYELKEEASELNSIGRYEFSTPILEKLILDYGFKSSKLFKSICINYLRLNQPENALKWIYGFFNKTKRINNAHDWWFLNKLSEFNVKTNHFIHDSLFFDKYANYLTKADFKENEVYFPNLSDYISLVKSKNEMILKGIELENTNLKDAIIYYHSILNHELFANDYYVYRSLAMLYDDIGDYESEIDIIISFFKSGIYCDRYVYIFFLYNLKRLSHEFVIYDDEIDDCLKSFKEVSFENKHLENFPVPLADRIIYKNNEINIVQGDEFNNEHEISALYFELDLFESCGKIKSATDILEIMIKEYGFQDGDLYKQVCSNYQKLNDTKSEIEIINHYFENNTAWNLHNDKWFNDRLEKLKNIENSSAPFDEPDFEVLYENNIYYLSHTDFKNNASEGMELIDQLISKLKIRYQGWRLEFTDYMQAIDFYTSHLDNKLFDNDYYIYRRLVLCYEKINDFEMVWQTINEFFHSGIYCNRYQYIWFLHKIIDISMFKFISDDEINDCLKSFKENGFKNKYSLDSGFLTGRIYRSKSSLKMESSSTYCEKEIRYEIKEEALQLDLNGFGNESTEILRKMVDNGCETSIHTYMRLCHRYREVGDLDNELEIINKYLSSNNPNARHWFEKRLAEIYDLRNNVIYV